MYYLIQNCVLQGSIALPHSSLETNPFNSYRNRVFLKIARLKLISLSTEKEVEAFYKQQSFSPLSLKTPSISDHSKKMDSNIKSPPYRRDSEITKHEGDSSITISQLLKQQGTQIDCALRNMDEIRRDLDSIKKSKDEMNEIRRDIDSIKQRIDEMASRFVTSEELELVADTVTQLDVKTSEVDRYPIEIKTIKKRIKTLEQIKAFRESSHTFTGFAKSNPQSPMFTRFPGVLPKRPNPLDVVSTSPEISDARQPTDPSTTSERSRALLRDSSIQVGDVEMSTEPTAGAGFDAAQTGRDSEPQDIMHSTKPTSFFASENIEKSVNDETQPHRSSVPPKFDLRASTPSTLSSAQSAIFPAGPSTPSMKLSEPKSATSLNSHKVIPGSDPEDEDYNPRTNGLPKSPLPCPSRSRGSARGTRGRPGRAHGRRDVPGFPLPDPEWERPDWDGNTKPVRHDQDTPSARRRGILRRGVGGRMVGIKTEPRNDRLPVTAGTFPEREAMTSAEASPTAEQAKKRDLRGRILNSEGIPLAKNGLPDLRFTKRVRDEEGIKLTRWGEPDGRSVKRLRDESGVLIKPNGEVDGRSARAKRVGKGAEGGEMPESLNTEASSATLTAG